MHAPLAASPVAYCGAKLVVYFRLQQQQQQQQQEEKLATECVLCTVTVASPSASASKKPKTFANLLFLMSDHFSYRRAGDDKTQRLPRSQRPKTTTKAYRRRQAQIQTTANSQRQSQN
ncbi:hypothetical protein ACLKA7_011879 [Drosophila subpalustris]